jgi:sec-independent protein translocase protein TatB
VLGINGSEFLVLLAVAAVVLGPERLPQYTQQLTRLIRELRRMAQGAQEKVREELGPDFDDVDWRKLDPRQYDPRRIVREALADAVDFDDPLGVRDDNRSGRSAGSPSNSSSGSRPSARPSGADAPTADSAGPGGGRESLFDPDAT